MRNISYFMFKIYKYFFKLQIFKIILVGIIAPLLINIFFSIMSYIAGLDNPYNGGYTTDFKDFLLIVVIAPLIETIIFQYTPLKIAEQFLDKSKFIFCIPIIITSILFGLLHWKSGLYIFVAFFYGLSWSFCCLVFMRRKQGPIFYTAFIHSCYNGLLFCLTLAINLFET